LQADWDNGSRLTGPKGTGGPEKEKQEDWDHGNRKTGAREAGGLGREQKDGARGKRRRIGLGVFCKFGQEEPTDRMDK
jgi:hypothetical protein